MVLLVISFPALAVIVEYSLDDFGNNSYQYNYSVTNDDLVARVDEFSIYFDLNLYENLAITGSSVGWDPLILQPDTSLPDDGIADWFTQSASIAIGETLSGFSVRFDWLGAGIPSSQLFEVVDPLTFNVLSDGLTVSQIASVPEPGSLSLLALGLFGVLVSKKRYKIS